MNYPATKAPQSQTPAQRSAGTSNHKLLLNGSQDFHLRELNAKSNKFDVRRTRGVLATSADVSPAAKIISFHLSPPIGRNQECVRP